MWWDLCQRYVLIDLVPIISNCVTISGVDKDFSKHINVEFRCHEAKIAFLEHLKNVLHHLEHN